MIGSGLKKLALENGLKVSHGVAYGSLQGYAATMAEGAGFKQILFSTQIKDGESKSAFLEAVAAVDVKKEYRVIRFECVEDGIVVVFHDNPGTMAKIKGFIAWFIPLLRMYGATAANVCPVCGCEITNGKWVLAEGVARYVHEACAEKMARDMEADNTRTHEEDTGSYGKGLLGALLGATVGAVVWAVVLLLGYLTALVGLLIGWLAEKGYTLLKGKQGKGKIAILIVAIIFGVLLGTVGAYGISLANEIAQGTVEGFTYGDIPGLLLVLVLEDAAFRSSVIGNVVMGLLFAALGAYVVVRNTGREVAGKKMIDLE